MKFVAIAWTAIVKLFEICVVLFVLGSIQDARTSIIVSVLGIIYTTIITVSAAHMQGYFDRLRRIEVAVMQMRQALIDADREALVPIEAAPDAWTFNKTITAAYVGSFAIYVICLVNIFTRL